MDTTKTITHLGLCAGYGGIELGIKRVIPALRTVALCEIEAFAVANLVSKMEAGLMDAAPVWTDLKTFPWEAFRDRVDVLTGGYPCQPFSAAGKRLGTDDPRHLWPFIAKGIRILQPRLCFFENVEGHISLGLSDVIEDLGRLGYRTTWGIFSASECGAPHQRKRVFILAMANNGGEGLQGLWKCCGSQGWQAQTGHAGGGCSVWPSRPGQPQYGWEPPRVVADTKLATGPMEIDQREKSINQDGADLRDKYSTISSAMADSHRIDRSAPAEGREHDRQVGSAGEDLGNAKSLRSGESTDGFGQAASWADASSDEDLGDTEEQRCWRLDDEQGKISGREARGHIDRASNSKQQGQWQIEPTLGRNFNEPSHWMDYAELCVTCDNRTDELRLLGNGVVPATAALAFRTLMNDLCSPQF